MNSSLALVENPEHSKAPLLSVNEFLDLILPHIAILRKETVSITECSGRILAEDVLSRLTQPKYDLASCDGFAICIKDMVQLPVTLEIMGESSAGKPFIKPVTPGHAVRVYAGSPIPEGTEAIAPLGYAEYTDRQVTLKKQVVESSNICFRGLDFAENEPCLKVGKVMHPRNICLAAAMNTPWLVVYHNPRVALFTCGDELAMPGDTSKPGATFACTNLALSAYVRRWNGRPMNLGICADDPAAIGRTADAATGMDLLITTGALSEAANNTMQYGLEAAGYEVKRYLIDFGHPTAVLFGERDGVPVLSLPGNPIACLLCIHLILRHILRAMHGMEYSNKAKITAQLGRDLDANDLQQNYLRSFISTDSNGRRIVNPVSSQDNMLISSFTEADCLLMVNPHACKKGDTSEIIPLDSRLEAF